MNAKRPITPTNPSGGVGCLEGWSRRLEASDSLHPANRQFSPTESFEGPSESGGITDFWASPLGPLLLLAMLGLCGYSLASWDSQSFFAHDLRGRYCGVAELKEKPRLYFLQPAVDPRAAICVSECPSSTGGRVCIYAPDGNTPTPFCYTEMSTVEVGELCIPEEIRTRREFLGVYYTPQRLARQAIRDIWSTLELAAGFWALAGVAAFGVLQLLQRRGAALGVLWAALLSPAASAGVLALFFDRQAKRTLALRCLGGVDRHGCGGIEATAYRGATFGCLGLAAASLAILALQFNRFMLVVSLVDTSRRFCKKLGEVRVAPVLAGAGVLVLATVGAAAAARVFAAGSLMRVTAAGVDGGKVKTFEFDWEPARKFLPALIPLWLVAVELVGEFLEFTVAWMMTGWYFSRNKRVVDAPLRRAARRAVQGHLGTIFLAAVAQLLRPLTAPVTWGVDKLLSWRSESPAPRDPSGSVPPRVDSWKSRVKSVTTVILAPLVWLHIQLLRFLSPRYAAHSALWSSGYLRAGQQAYFLSEVRNRTRARGGGPDAFYAFVLLELKTAVALLAAAGLALTLELAPSTPLGVPLDSVKFRTAPVLLSLLVGYKIAGCFFDSFEAINRTIVQCFYIDEEMFVGAQRYAEGFVAELIEFYAADDNENAEVIAGFHNAAGAEAPMLKRAAAPAPPRSDDDLPGFEPPMLDPENDVDRFRTKRAVNRELDLVLEGEEPLRELPKAGSTRQVLNPSSNLQGETTPLNPSTPQLLNPNQDSLRKPRRTSFAPETLGPEPADVLREISQKQISALNIAEPPSEDKSAGSSLSKKRWGRIIRNAENNLTAQKTGDPSIEVDPPSRLRKRQPPQSSNVDLHVKLGGENNDNY